MWKGERIPCTSLIGGKLFHVCIIKEKIVKIIVCRQLRLDLFEYKKQWNKQKFNSFFFKLHKKESE